MFVVMLILIGIYLFICIRALGLMDDLPYDDSPYDWAEEDDA